MSACRQVCGRVCVCLCVRARSRHKCFVTTVSQSTCQLLNHEPLAEAHKPGNRMERDREATFTAVICSEKFVKSSSWRDEMFLLLEKRLFLLCLVFPFSLRFQRLLLLFYRPMDQTLR